MVAFLSDPPVVDVVKKFMGRLHRHASARHKNSKRDIDRKMVGVMLAAYLIVYHPGCVFDPQLGDAERDLIDLSRRLVERVEWIALCVLESGSFHGVSHELTANALPLLDDFFERFWLWRIHDREKLKPRIKEALISLEDSHAMFHHHHRDEESEKNASLVAELKGQIKNLREKLVLIAGRRELEKFDESRKEARERNAHENKAENHCTTNEQLAHELLLDPAFQLPDSGIHEGDDKYGLADRERDFKVSGLLIGYVHHVLLKSFPFQVFWDNLTRDLLLSPPCYVRVIGVLDSVREGIHEVSADQHSEIDGIIDISLIKQQVKNGAFDWNSCTRLVHSVVSVIERIQESRRAEQTSEMYALVRAEMEHVTFSSSAGTSEFWPHVLCKALDFLVNRISALRIDAANCR